MWIVIGERRHAIAYLRKQLFSPCADRVPEIYNRLFSVAELALQRAYPLAEALMLCRLREEGWLLSASQSFDLLLQIGYPPPQFF